MAEQTLVVIDHFYDYPDKVRTEALQLEYSITGRFPGRNTANHDVQGTMSYVGRLLRRNICCDGRSRDITFFRLTRGSDQGSCDIHVDPTGWAGVCYLNPPEQCYGGTSFFRHKQTGLTRWPTAAEAAELRAAGIVEPSPDPRIDDLSHYFIREGSIRERWEEICVVPMRHNRAIFYDAKQFHSISAWDRFGETDETARLTRLFFFNT